jgi:8-oxo-dGTP pyrophosphatase MutT (NUDIX family)
MPVDLQVADAGSVPLRTASTVMILRDVSDGFEVCMLRRNLNSDFVGGAYVFPGGAVDPEDAHELAYVTGRSDDDASRQVGVDQGGLAYWVAAVREAFEEAGLLLARGADGRLISFDDPAVHERFVEHRRLVDSGERRLTDICAEESLTLAADRIWAVSRWVTPVGAPRRYDTRFFVAAAPAEQEAIHDDREVIATVWIRPQDALDKQRRGEFELIFPTVRSLEMLSRFGSTREVLEHAATIGELVAVTPTIVSRDGAIRLRVEGDAEYDPVTWERLADAT